MSHAISADIKIRSFKLPSLSHTTLCNLFTSEELLSLNSEWVIVNSYLMEEYKDKNVKFTELKNLKSVSYYAAIIQSLYNEYRRYIYDYVFKIVNYVIIKIDCVL